MLQSRVAREVAMTLEEQERMTQLCKGVVNEKDPQKFNALVDQLNQLLGKKRDRIAEPPTASNRGCNL